MQNNGLLSLSIFNSSGAMPDKSLHHSVEMSVYKILNENGVEIQPDVVLHPGDILQDELDARNATLSEFAELLRMKTGNLIELLNGTQKVSADLILKKLVPIQTKTSNNKLFYVKVKEKRILNI